MQQHSELWNAIVNYAKAESEALENPKLLVKDYNANKDICSMRCVVAKKAESVLFSLIKDDVKLPKALADFYHASNDRGCSSCWVSSRNTDMHAVCKEKIDRYFEARRLLVKYGLELLERNSKNNCVATLDDG